MCADLKQVAKDIEVENYSACVKAFTTLKHLIFLNY